MKNWIGKLPKKADYGSGRPYGVTTINTTIRELILKK